MPDFKNNGPMAPEFAPSSEPKVYNPFSPAPAEDEPIQQTWPPLHSSSSMWAAPVPPEPVAMEKPYKEYAEALVEFTALKRKLAFANDLECRAYLRRGLEQLEYSPEAIEYFAFRLNEKLTEIWEDSLDDYLTGGADDYDCSYERTPEEIPGYDRWQMLRRRLPELKKDLKRRQ